MAKKSKSSEHGLGGFIDDHKGTKLQLPLHVRVWSAILKHRDVSEEGYAALRFPARRRLPLTRPSLLAPFRAFNRRKPYHKRIKPFGFLQTVVAATESEKRPRLVAPFEKNPQKSRSLPWIDLADGQPANLDWFGTYPAGTVAVQTLDEFARLYARHPEQKAAGRDGLPADSGCCGVLGRLHITSVRPTCIGKEVDRLSEDQDMNIDDQEPVRYPDDESDVELEEALATLRQLSQVEVADRLDMSERRYRDIEHHRVRPRKRTRDAILRLADEVGVGSGSWQASESEEEATLERGDGGALGGWAVLGVILFIWAVTSGRFSGR